jgi:hypothetical protein
MGNKLVKGGAKNNRFLRRKNVLAEFSRLV